MTEIDEALSFKVLVNGNGQYSLWREDIPVPLGWTLIGFKGNRQACIEFVDLTWLEMRPLSQRLRSSPHQSEEFSP
ncbi:MbtH family protein [Rhizobium rhizogenes]|uniref:MbtH family protein n=1 Tax=Rhizobium rhizogenes TaxID=359 RepID=UPI001295BF65|nr:MbtH family NRPS accessory protein [Rhizobium rhizogenes]MQB34204.1 MbtH family protein [Rhizobium rhizogenes]